MPRRAPPDIFVFIRTGATTFTACRAAACILAWALTAPLPAFSVCCPAACMPDCAPMLPAFNVCCAAVCTPAVASVTWAPACMACRADASAVAAWLLLIPALLTAGPDTVAFALPPAVVCTLPDCTPVVILPLVLMVACCAKTAPEKVNAARNNTVDFIINGFSGI